MMKRLTRLYLNLKIPDKIRYINIGFFIILFIIIAIAGNMVAHNITVKKALAVTDNNFVDIKLYFDGLNKKTSQRLRYLSSSVSMQQILREKRRFYETGESISDYRLNTLLEEIANIKYIESINIYDIKGNNIAKYQSGTESQNHSFLYETTLQKVFESEEDIFWYDDNTNMFLDEKRLKLYKKVMDSDDNSILGVIEIMLNTNEVMDLYNHIGFNKAAQLFVMTNAGNIVLPLNDNGKAELVKHSFTKFSQSQPLENKIVTKQGVRYLLKETFIPKYNIYVAGVLNYDDIIKEKQEICNIIYLIGFILILFELFFSIILSKSISSPIVMLAGNMQKISAGDLNVRTSLNRKDEIGILSQTFDEILDTVQKLMNELEVSEKMKRKLQLLSLQTQINPHFLYNSLESLGALAQLKYTDDLYRMSKALSLFYKGVLSDGRSIVTLKEELNIIDNYLTIQHIRYVDVFDYKIDVDEKFMDIKVVKLSVQPFVENAIYHGLKLSRKEKGNIIINCKQEGENAVISIIDNGIGFDVCMADCDKEDNKFREEEDNLKIKRKGFGIANVNKRIKLYFGEKYGVNISSKVDVGTTVKIILPLEAPEGDN